MLRERGLVAFVCIVVLLATAMAPVASGSFCAILVPLPTWFGAMVSVLPARTDLGRLPSLLAIAPLTSRAPPVA